MTQNYKLQLKNNFMKIEFYIDYEGVKIYKLKDEIDNFKNKKV